MPQLGPGPPSRPVARLDRIDGPALRRAFLAGAEALRAAAPALDAINVFPVPDGDTGTNMSLTLAAAVDALADDALDAAGVMSTVARATLLGARGNSGVILSQVFAGAARALARSGHVGGAGLAAAIEAAREAAYAVVSEPREGTILTAVSEAAAAARNKAGEGAGAGETLAAARDGASEAARRSPELLPVLRDAGVVDAGAQGLVVLLDGMLAGLRGEAAAGNRSFGAIDAAWLEARHRAHRDGETPGFCTEFVVAAPAEDHAALRARFAPYGDSLLLASDGGALRVHIHTRLPDEVLAAARRLGVVSREKVDDMSSQAWDVALPAAGGEGFGTIAVVAVGAGAGIERLMRSLGAAAVVRGGPAMNPSAREIRDAIVGTGAPHVFVLPGNANAVMAAEQAVALAGDRARARVLPVRSVQQGIAALVAMSREASLEENMSVMGAAAAAVRTAEVTHAARATRVAGIDVPEGQPIGIVEGALCITGPSVDEVAEACVRRLIEEGDVSLVTLYAGEGVDPGASGELARRLRAGTGVDVEVIEGGQPYYPYLIAVEA